MIISFCRNIAKALVLIGFLVSLFSLASCSSAPFKLFDYVDKPFEATVGGVFGEQEVKSDIFCDFSKSSADSDEKKILVVARLSSPDALKGAVVTLYSDGEVSLRLGELEAPAADYRGLCELYLLLCPEGEPYSVEIIDGEGRESGTLVVFSDDSRELSYFFREGEDFPAYIRGIYRGKSVDIAIEKAKFATEK